MVALAWITSQERGDVVLLVYLRGLRAIGESEEAVATNRLVPRDPLLLFVSMNLMSAFKRWPVLHAMLFRWVCEQSNSSR